MKKRFEMSHIIVDRNTFLIYKFLINRWNVIINRIHFNFKNKIKPERNKTEAQGSSSQCAVSAWY